MKIYYIYDISNPYFRYFTLKPNVEKWNCRLAKLENDLRFVEVVKHEREPQCSEHEEEIQDWVLSFALGDHLFHQANGCVRIAAQSENVDVRKVLVSLLANNSDNIHGLFLTTKTIKWLIKIFQYFKLNYIYYNNTLLIRIVFQR